MASPAPARRTALAALGTIAACLVVTTTSAPGSSSPPLVAATPEASSALGTVPARVAAKKQTVTLRVLPPLAQPGPTAAGVAGARSVVLATVTPAKSRRPVLLERKKGRTWKKVGRAFLDRRGTAQLVLPAAKGTSPRYRVTAKAFKGRRAVSGPTFRAAGWGAPTFVDDFAGDALGTSWAHRVQHYDPAGLRNCAKGDPAAVALTGGALRLSVVPDPARPEPCTAYRADGSLVGQFRYRLNGHVSTAGQKSLHYGFAAARMKFQKDRGQHASFWMQPVPYLPNATSAAEGGAEIDIIEWFGDSKRGGLATFLYHPTTGGRQKVGGKLDDPDSFLAAKSDRWWRGYHVFSLEWTPTEYIFRIDGRETWRTSVGISQVPQYPIVSLLSSDYELLNLGGEDRLPQHMYVDWVAMWQS